MPCEKPSNLLMTTEPGRTEQLFLSGIDLCFPESTWLVERCWRGLHPPGVPPHLTILAPWRTPVTSDDLEQLSTIVSRHSFFEVTFDSVGCFEGGFVYLDPGANGHLERLIEDVRDAFSDTPPYGGTIADPVPHLTIGRAPPGEELGVLHASVEAGLGQHLPVTLTVDTVTVLVAQPDDTWTTHAEIPLCS